MSSATGGHRPFQPNPSCSLMDSCCPAQPYDTADFHAWNLWLSAVTVTAATSSFL